METNNKLLISFAIAILIVFAFSVFSYVTTPKGGEWVCIAKQCSKFATGDEWAVRFCKFNDEKTDIICRFSVDDIPYEIPLNKINTSQVKSCIEEICATEIYVRKHEVRK